MIYSLLTIHYKLTYTFKMEKKSNVIISKLNKNNKQEEANWCTHLMECLHDDSILLYKLPPLLVYTVVLLKPVHHVNGVDVKCIVGFHKAVELQQGVVGFVSVGMGDLQADKLTSLASLV